MDAALSFSEQLYHQISRQANDVTDPDVETRSAAPPTGDAWRLATVADHSLIPI
jgi:hypothetical protein